MQPSALIVDPRDNVATAVRVLPAGETIQLTSGGTTIDVFLTESIPFGHKFSLKSIPLGSAVVKYGETIGLSTRDINPGQHVHIHNVEGRRGRGDIK